MFSKPTTPQSIGQVLDGSFRLTAMSFRHVWLYAVLAGISGNLATIYQLLQGGGAVVQALTGPADGTYFALALGGGALSLLFAGAMYVRSDAVVDGREGDSSSKIGAVLPRWPMIIVVTVLYMLAVMVGSILLIVPGVILLVSLYFSTAVLLLEGSGPIEALTTSHRLVWGHWWRTFFIAIIGLIIVMVIWFMLGAVGAALAPMLGGGDAIAAMLIGFLIVYALLGVVIAPFFVSLSLTIYWDLKLRKEGGDLQARAQAV